MLGSQHTFTVSSCLTGLSSSLVLLDAFFCNSDDKKRQVLKMGVTKTLKSIYHKHIRGPNCENVMALYKMRFGLT